jgi:hypothetical protein
MHPEEIANRLKEHSGLSVPAPELEGSTFADKVRAVERGEQPSGLEEAVMDVIECLQRLNQSNQNAPKARGDILSVQVVYAISGMTLLAFQVARKLCKTEKSCTEVLKAGWQIACAWDAVVAGDIEDLHEHLRYEAAGRNLD